MKLTNLRKESNLVTFDLEDEYKELEIFIDRKYKELSKKTKIPGFRKGKVPKGVFINNYGMERLSYDALIELLNTKYPSIIKEHQIDVIDQPKDINILQLEEDKPVKVSLAVEVKPDVKVGKYKGVKLEKDAVKVAKEEVSTEIDRFLESHATYDEDKAAVIKEGDVVTLDMKATLDGEPYERWSKSKEIIKIGNAIISADFDQEISGLTTKDKKSFELEFPIDYSLNPDVAGQTVSFEIKILKVKVKNLPEFTDEFIADKTDFMSVDDYKKSIEEKMRANKELAAENGLKDQVANWIIENVKVEVPEVMIQQEVEYLLRRMEGGLKSYNMDLAAYLKLTQKTLDDLRADYREEAQRSVKLRMGVEWIAKDASLEATEEEIAEEIEDSVKFEKDEEKRKKLVQQLEWMKDNVKESVIHKKVIDFIQEYAKIKQKK